jgi:hypothetical protein
MADKHNVRKGVEIDFADGVTRSVYPLNIKQLRKFVKIIGKMKDLENMNELSDEDIDIMVDAAAIVVAAVDKDLAEDREALEEALDLKCFNELMGIAMGASSPEA